MRRSFALSGLCHGGLLVALIVRLLLPRAAALIPVVAALALSLLGIYTINLATPALGDGQLAAVASTLAPPVREIFPCASTSMMPL